MESLHLVLLRCHFLPRGLRLAAILPIGGVKLSLVRLHSAINTLIHLLQIHHEHQCIIVSIDFRFAIVQCVCFYASSKDDWYEEKSSRNLRPVNLCVPYPTNGWQDAPSQGGVKSTYSNTALWPENYRILGLRKVKWGFATFLRGFQQ